MEHESKASQNIALHQHWADSFLQSCKKKNDDDEDDDDDDGVFLFTLLSGEEGGRRTGSWHGSLRGGCKAVISYY